MRYIRAEEVLPREVLAMVQNYVDGVTLYIPRKAENRRDWGCGTGYRQELESRNEAIRRARDRGAEVCQLAREYHLSEKSIHRILRTK